MFPPGSPLHDVVSNCYGNGLKALKAILLRSHPAFVDEPSTLVTTYPKQKDKSLLEYKMEAEGFLQMRAIVQGHSRELDDPGELDIFINNMKYNTFVQRVARDERRQRVLLHKYQGDKLLETLNSVLMMPDCPGRNGAISTSRVIPQVSTPPRQATTGARTSRIPPLRTRQGARVNAVGARAQTRRPPVVLAVEELVVDPVVEPIPKSTTTTIKASPIVPMKMLLGHLRTTRKLVSI